MIILAILYTLISCIYFNVKYYKLGKQSILQHIEALCNTESIFAINNKIFVCLTVEEIKKYENGQSSK